MTFYLAISTDKYEMKHIDSQNNYRKYRQYTQYFVNF